ncbi:MAG TPA: hypothetical protein VED01_13665 [Burkholderiales bacterium]|nr:hypothetical protein [Burkholderiales bacterium]
MNRTVKALAITLGALVTICVLLVAAGMYLYYFQFDAGPRDSPLGALEHKVQQDLHDALSKRALDIRLVEVADFAWEQACVVQPYTTEQTLNKAAGMKLRGYSTIGWIDNESYWTLVFIAGDEIKPVRIGVGRSGRYDSGGAFVECAPRATAVLTYRVEEAKGLPPREFYFSGRQR